MAVAITVDAMALAARVDCLTIVPGASELSALTNSLRASGVRVETASFGEHDRDADLPVEGHQTLGAECMFVP